MKKSTGFIISMLVGGFLIMGLAIAAESDKDLKSEAITPVKLTTAKSLRPNKTNNPEISKASGTKKISEPVSENTAPLKGQKVVHNMLSPKDVKIELDASYSSKVFDNSFLAKNSDIVVIGVIKQIFPVMWNAPTGQIKDLGLDAQGYSKGRVWLDENGNERSEGELGVFGAIPVQDYLVQVDEVLKDNEPPTNRAQSNEEWQRMTKWKPDTKVFPQIIRVRIVNPDQYTLNQESVFQQGDRILMMLNKTDNVSTLVGPEHFTLQMPFNGFKLTQYGFAVRNNVPSKAKLPLDEVRDSINKVTVNS